MRTLELHAPVKHIQRSKGRSSVAAAAYRSASRLIDDRTGLVHDYTKKQGVEHSRIYVPDSAPQWATDRAQLWNAAEVKENRANSCTANELELSFPAEFNAMQRREAGDKICHELMRRYECAVDISYHSPGKHDDERNFHAHILFTSRGFDPATKDGWARKKYRNFSNDKVTIDGKNTTQGKQELLSLREFSANELNRIAERDRLNVKTEHLSFKARGIDREPTQHRGHAATQMERRGEASRIENLNRVIKLRNAMRANNYARMAQQAAAMSRKKDFENALKRKHEDLTDKNTIALKAMEKRHRLEQEKLEKRLGEDTSRKTIQSEIESVERRLQAKGIAKVVRDVFRKNATDKKNLINLQKSLKFIENAEKQKRWELQIKQQEERDKLKEQKSDQESVKKEQQRVQSTTKQTESRSQKKGRKKGDKPEPTPPPPREALSIAQQWGERSGQNTNRISESVRNREIDTSKLAFKDEVKPEKQKEPSKEESRSNDNQPRQQQRTAKRDLKPRR